MQQKFYSPMQSMNAFMAGDQMGQQKRKRETQNAFSQMIGDKDYSGARDYAYGRGAMELGGAADGILAGQAQQTQAAEQEKRRQIHDVFKAVKSLDRGDFPDDVYLQQRFAEAQRLSQGLGLPEPTELADVSDEKLDSQIRMLGIQGGFEETGPEYGFMNVDGQLFQTNKTQGGATALTERSAPEQWIDVPAPAGQEGYFQKNEATGAVKRVSAPSGPLVNVNTGDGTPGNRPIVNKPPAGFQRVWDEDNHTYRDIPIPGSDAEREAQADADRKTSRNDPTTIDSLIGSYATLNENKAIRSTQNTAGDNFAAMYSKSPPGRFQDALGGKVGNADNDTARDNIEGISMNMLMKMISMSDVSARAMDSDAEMKAWLSAIKGDQYESALTKLHVLDVSFGSGEALQRAYAKGDIELETYEYVTQRAGSDPVAIEMGNRMSRYSALEGSVGAENLTQSEAAELEALREWKASQNAE